MQNQSTMLNLGYLGLLPFIAGLVLAIMDQSLLGMSGEKLFVTYSAIILSFLSGVMWGSVLDHFAEKKTKVALILSNAFALLAWGALLIANLQLAILLLAIGFIAVWFCEKQSRQALQQTQPAAYQTLRFRLTAGVVLMHIVLFLI